MHSQKSSELDVLVVLENMTPSPTNPPGPGGILPQHRLCFTASGFWYSGSGAVVDWLRGNDCFIKPPGRENQAVRNVFKLLQLAEGAEWHGEKMARYWLFPDHAQWGEYFPQSVVKGSKAKKLASKLYDDFEYLKTTAFRPANKAKFEKILSSNLQQDYRDDRFYSLLLRETLEAIAGFLERGGNDACIDEKVQDTISRFIAYFYDIWATNNRIPIMDNSIGAKYSQYLELISQPHFRYRVSFIVQRDPRDQLADIISKSPRNISTSGALGRMITQYKKGIGHARRLSDKSPTSFAETHLYRFEDFVTNADGVRTNSNQIVERVLKQYGFESRWMDGYFDPAESARNIGQWKKFQIDRHVRKIERELGEYLHPLAD